MCVYSGPCDVEMFEKHCFRQSKTAGRQPAFSSSELNTTQHGFDRSSACMLSLWSGRTISPCSWAKQKETQRDSCEQMWKWWGSQPCEMHFFLTLNLMNFEALIANLSGVIQSLMAVLCCLSVCRLQSLAFQDGDYVTSLGYIIEGISSEPQSYVWLITATTTALSCLFYGCVDHTSFVHICMRNMQRIWMLIFIVESLFASLCRQTS